MNQIGQMLDNLCLGKFNFEAGNILRNSLLLSTLISNSEVWYNLTNKDISKLESVDEALLRRILSAHSKTPLELLYLETGNIPIRFIIMARRLNFLWYILNEEEDLLIRRCLEAQMDHPSRGNWVKTVTEDMKDLEINLDKPTIDQIEGTDKLTFKQIIKSKVQRKAFEHLTKLKDSHSKARKLRHKNLEMQRYLKPETEDLTIIEKKFIFAARTRMLDLKGNFKSGLAEIKCRKCHMEEETQKHLLECPQLSDNGLVAECPAYGDLFSAKPAIIGKILKRKFKKFKTPCAPCL